MADQRWSVETLKPAVATPSTSLMSISDGNILRNIPGRRRHSDHQADALLV